MKLFDGPVALIGGGPSLKGFNFDKLNPCRCIAINRALEQVPAKVLWWSDERFWRRNGDAIARHPAELKATGLRKADSRFHSYPHPIQTYRFTGMLGWDDREDCLRHGNNGGYAAMHLAPKLGAMTLVLFGFDMGYDAGGATHYHDGHGYATRPEANLTRQMLPHFVHLVAPLKTRGIAVFNANPDSRIDCWPRITPDEGVEIVNGHC